MFQSCGAGSVVSREFDEGHGWCGLKPCLSAWKSGKPDSGVGAVSQQNFHVLRGGFIRNGSQLYKNFPAEELRGQKRKDFIIPKRKFSGAQDGNLLKQVQGSGMDGIFP